MKNELNTATDFSCRPVQGRAFRIKSTDTSLISNFVKLAPLRRKEIRVGGQYGYDYSVREHGIVLESNCQILYAGQEGLACERDERKIIEPWVCFQFPLPHPVQRGRDSLFEKWVQASLIQGRLASST
jgi:hypothetical protein